MGEARAQGRPGRKHVWGSAGPGQRPARGRRRAARLAWPRRGPAGPHLRPIPTFRHFREKLNDSLVSRTASSSSTLSTPLACPARPLHREWARGAGALAASLSPWTCVCVRVCVRERVYMGFSFSCLGCRLSFPQKRAGKKRWNSSFIKMEFCCKEKRC